MADTKEQITTLDVATTLVTRGPDEKTLTAWLEQLERDDLMRVWARSKPIAKAAGAVARIAKKITAGTLALGETWTDPDTKVEYVWANGKSDDWKVEDPEGLAIGLAKLERADGSRLFTDAEIERALPHKRVPDHKELTALASRADEARELIDDMREKPDTAPDLRERGK